MCDKVVLPIPKCGARKLSYSPAARKIKAPKTNYLLLLCLEFRLKVSIVKGCADKLSEGCLR
jgi:hypothetical protein